MKALVLTAANRLELLEVPEPSPGDDEVLVRVSACGICGSDVHGMDGSTGRRKPPVIMGHEAAGVVERVGPAVRAVAPGDRVTFDSTIYCGACWYCRRGMVNLCDNRRVLGVSCDEYRRDGAFAELVAVPERIVYRLPPGVSFQQAAMVEPVSIALHAVRRFPPGPATSAVVVGAGMIGTLVVQLAVRSGAHPVVVVDVDPGRLALARRLGAHLAVDSRTADVATEVRSVTDGRGADLAFEVVGASAALAAALGSLRKGGTLVMVGNLSPTVEFAQQAAVTREISLLGSCASANDYPDCLRLIEAGDVDVAALTSAVAPLADGPSWFARLQRREPGLMKVLLTP